MLTSLCFAPFEQTWLCWIALTPLLAAVWFSGAGSKRRWLRDFFLGYRRGRDFFLGRFFLASHRDRSGMVIVGLYMGVYFALWSLAGRSAPAAQAAARAGAATKHAWPPPQHNDLPLEARSLWLSSFHNLWLALVLAAAWTALEWVRGWMFSGWGWNGLGVALHDILPLIQVAEITGVAGLSFLVAFANVIAIATVRRFMLEARVQGAPTALRFHAHHGRHRRALRLRHPRFCKSNARRSRCGSGRCRRMCRARKNSARIPAEDLRPIRAADSPGPGCAAAVQLVIWPESSMPAPVLVDELTTVS